MSTPAMHLAVVGKEPRPCDTCGTVFTPKRGWARFCKPDCRNAFHASEARLVAVRDAAPALYEALRQVMYQPSEPRSHAIALAAIKDLKPPESPKALLEKAKA